MRSYAELMRCFSHFMRSCLVIMRRYPGSVDDFVYCRFKETLKHNYDVIHCSFRTLFSSNVQINAYRPKCSERIDFWTVSKDIGQLANTTRTVVFLRSSSVLFFK